MSDGVAVTEVNTITDDTEVQHVPITFLCEGAEDMLEDCAYNISSSGLEKGCVYFAFHYDFSFRTNMQNLS